MRKPTAKQQAKIDDKRVETAFYRTCDGIQINMMDIVKVFAHGRKAIESGADDARLETEVRAFVETIRQN